MKYTDLITISTLGHWGVVLVYVVEDEDGKGLVRWGYSLNRNNPDGLLSTVGDVYGEVIGNVDWCAEKRPTCMTTDLPFTVQEDGYACGSYVMCAIRMRGL